MVPKKTAQSIDTLLPVYSLIIFSVIEAIFPSHKNLETVIGGHLELTTLVVAVAVAKMVALYLIKYGPMKMDVHRETVLTPGIAFAGHGYY